MSLRFVDSFSHYNTADLFGLGNGSKYTSLGTSVTQQNTYIVPGGGRFGSSALHNSASALSAVIKILDAQATWIMGVAFRYNVTPSSFASFMGLSESGTTQVELAVNTDNTLSVMRNGTALTNSLNGLTKSTASLSLNTWYYIEFMCTISNSISANTCKVNVNGSNTNWINISAGQNTRNTANSNANAVNLGKYANMGNTNGTTYFDFCDFYVCDGNGSTNNAFLGDVRVEARYPLAAGTNTAWGANGGTAVACVSDQNINGDVSYISSSNANDISTFTVPTLAVNPTTIYGMQVTHVTRKTDAGVRQVADVIRSGSTNYVGTTVNLGPQYQQYSSVWETDPNTTAAWTYSAANSLEFGTKEIT